MTTEPFILYLEDERPMINLVQHALKIAGHDITSAMSGERGLEIMQEHKPDLLLLDLMMPGVNGWDVYTAMKKDDTLADVPVVVITAKIPDRSLIIVEGLPPVEDYITKPFDVEHLIRVVERHL